jgi:hypothetical protein
MLKRRHKAETRTNVQPNGHDPETITRSANGQPQPDLTF